MPASTPPPSDGIAPRNGTPPPPPAAGGGAALNAAPIAAHWVAESWVKPTAFEPETDWMKYSAQSTLFWIASMAVQPPDTAVMLEPDAPPMSRSAFVVVRVGSLML